jgi:hypothetical protein
MDEAAYQDLVDSRRRINQQFVIGVAVALGVLILGAIIFHLVEGFKWLDSFYFCVVTLTTIGYGDITPHTDLGKFIDIFYILTGVGILGAFINLTVRRVTINTNLRQANRERRQATKSKPL